MDGILTALIAVIGTLLGSIVTYQFQVRSSYRAEQVTFRQQLRSERMAIYSDFAGAITAYRRGEHDRWNRKNEDPGSPAYLEARMETYQLRSVALHSLFRVQLITDRETLLNQAWRTYHLTGNIHRAANAAEQKSFGDEARDALEHFISLASYDLQKSQIQSHSLAKTVTA
jgi:hypothetical protein